MNATPRFMIPVLAGGGFGARIDAAPDPVPLMVRERAAEASGGMLVSFMAYVTEKGAIDLYEPLVATPNGLITAEGATGLGDGTYYCHVYRTKVKGYVYSAVVDANEEAAGSGEHVVTTQIVKVEDGAVAEQFHVGTIVVDGGDEGGGPTEGFTGEIWVATGEMKLSEDYQMIMSAKVGYNVENGVVKSQVTDTGGEQRKEWVASGLLTTLLSAEDQ